MIPEQTKRDTPTAEVPFFLRKEIETIRQRMKDTRKEVETVEKTAAKDAVKKTEKDLLD